MVDQGLPIDAQCPSSAALLGYGGVAAAVCLSNWGSAVSGSKVSSAVSLLDRVLFAYDFCYRWERGKQGKV